MKQGYGFIAVLLLLTLGVPQPAPAATLEELEAKMEAMQRSHEQQIAELKRQIAGMRQTGEPVVAGPEPEAFPIKLAGVRSEAAPQFGGVYDKPFLKRVAGRTYLGGYIDMEYEDTQDTGRTFDQHRLIPFIYSDISDHIKFASEIEFEHGGPDNSQSDGEVKVEFATIDYLIREGINLRTGILLSPLGKLNALHDSPLQDLTARPLVDTNIIPTTLSEAGAGAFGSFYPTETAKVDYELYAVNGFDGGGNTPTAISGAINVNGGVRSARGSQNSDNNDNLAVVGRIGISPFLGAEVGGSIHHGAYSDDGNLDLTIAALDWAFEKGPFEFLGEYALANIERNAAIHAHNSVTAAADTSTSRIPGTLEGYYLQGNYHFMPPALRKWFPSHFKEESTFTAVARWEQVDLNGDETSLVGERDRLTLGLNFRPIEDTVLKLDYQFNSGNQAADDRDRVFVSAATYF